MVEIPPANVITPTQLILLQSILPTVDLWLLRTFPGHNTKRCLLGYHSVIPLLLTTNHPALDLFMVPTPIFVCAQNLMLPTPLPPIKDIVQIFARSLLEPNPPPDTTKVRQRAVIKIARGLFKHGIRTSILVPWLTPEPKLVELPWFSPISMANALGYGAALYCLVGTVVDVGTGMIQLITNRDFIELMDYPFLAHSRWNRIASSMFHRSVFSSTGTSALQKREAWDKSVAAMTAFTASGLAHELLVMSLFRHTNGENLCFFWLQGLATVAEVQNFGSKYAPQGIHRALSTATTFVWLGLTGRLFFLPYWKRSFFSQ